MGRTSIPGTRAMSFPQPCFWVESGMSIGAKEAGIYVA